MTDDVVLPGYDVERLRAYLDRWNGRDDADPPASGTDRYAPLIEMAGYIENSLDRAQGADA